MTPINRTDNEARSADVIAQNIEVLKGLFPEAVSEGKLDFSVLKGLIGAALLPDEERDEKYGLNWFGKRKARQIALTPSTGTLRPCKEDSVDWDTTKNLMIEGDNLEVLKLLQKSYAGQVKLIYIDPPYNTGKDFVYPDNFQDNIRNYLELTGQVEGGAKMQANTESSGRFHTDWLNMMYPRIKLAKNLLDSDGLFFVSIDENEASNLRLICDDIFGEENFVGWITRATGTPTGGGNKAIVNEVDYLIVYSKSTEMNVEGLPMTEDDSSIYDQEDEWGRFLIRPLRRTGGEDRREDRPSMYFPVKAPDGTDVYPIGPTGYESRWICGQKKYAEMVKNNLIMWKNVSKNGESVWQVYQKFYLEGRQKQPSNLWDDIEGNKKATRDLKKLFDDQKVFDFPKPLELIQRIIQMISLEDDTLILDFFAGSGTTGHAMYLQNATDNVNRRFILVQLPEPLNADQKDQKIAMEFCRSIGKPTNIAELTKERLRRAGVQVKANNSLFNGDLGFRSFKLDSSNILPWESEWDKLEEIVRKSVDHIKEGRTETDILYELLLKLGLDLAVPIEQKAIGSKKICSIGAGTLIVCLDKRISRSDAEPLALGIVGWHKELAPVGETTCVFLDSAFVDDVAKTNLSAILNQHGLANVRSL